MKWVSFAAIVERWASPGLWYCCSAAAASRAQATSDEDRATMDSKSCGD
jgi:hypothetical protein